jgi:phospholipase C
VGELPDAQARLIDEATAAPAGSASLSDIQHVVILMQENRSFDHYFGTLSGVRGFSDPHAISQTVDGQSYQIFDQFGYQPGQGADPSGYLQPFRLSSDPPLRDGLGHQRHPAHLATSARSSGRPTRTG